MNPINIIGVGQSAADMTVYHLELIKECDVLVGGKRLLKMFDTRDKKILVIKSKLSLLIDSIKEEAKSRKVVVLASGDPLFYGIGATLTRYFKKDQLTIHPNISSISAAFAAIKEPWHDARLISLHGKDSERLAIACRKGEEKIALLTDPKNDPHFIAHSLIRENILAYKLCVLEQLGHPQEQKLQWFDHPEALKGITFSQPNIVILKRKPKIKDIVSRETHIGMNDNSFHHQQGLITKSEVRAVTLSKLKITRNDMVLWDIGAGSGSVSVEASQLLPNGKIFAIEKHPERISDIMDNCKKFNCHNVSVVNDQFPSKTDTFDQPHRIFIGGGGKHIGKIIQHACDSLKKEGVIVINTVLLQTMEKAIRVLEENRFSPQVIQLQISRSKTMPFGQRMEALNPVWIISGSKPDYEDIK